MLLPSAISCDSSSQGSKPRYQPALFASPPLSPPPPSSSSSLSTIPNLYSTCRALQSMLTAPSQLPSPPTTHATIPAPAPASPFRLRLRTRRDEPPATAPPRKKITKRTAHAPPPRGLNKRRRATDVEPEDAEEDLERSVGEPEADMTDSASEDNNDSSSSSSSRPRTPKRMRAAPEVLPLGLERADFDALRGTETTEREEWTTEEDRVLVELVLEKLKLTKSDWQDCARSLGKDRGSVGRRWKSLMCAGEVGLKTRSRRGRIHGTWR